ncbi:invasion associated locus B family protein [Agrobacterium sp. CG160-95]|uniref:invasion associated locus B family protein n=1 Tax=Agrobacterium tumefaciens TaxID=358 RepID=UPI003013C57B
MSTSLLNAVVGISVATLLTLGSGAHGAISQSPDSRRYLLDEPGLAQTVSNDDSGAGNGDNAKKLANGADRIKEIYGDWAVECRMVEAKRACSMGQFYHNANTGMVMFAIELFPPENGLTKMLLRMPLGLRLSEGINLRLDDESSGQHAGIVTCTQEGCLVPLTLSASSIDTMKKAGSLKVSGMAFAEGANPVFHVSLKGFSLSFERLETMR